MSIETPIGTLYASFYQGKLSELSFTPPVQSSKEAESTQKALVEQLEKEILDYFNGTLRLFTIPLYINGTLFQNRVWNQLMNIPYGQTSSYAELAKTIGSPRAYRAVGGANSKNPIPIIIPCHRVINADKHIGGYSGEIWRKRYLLELEDCVFRI